MKKKTKTPSQLKKKTDELFSKYIRLKYSDEDGNLTCYTCDKFLHWKEAQCGHYITRGCLELRWEEENNRPQCVGCNVFKKGNYTEYSRRLIKEKGPDVLEVLNRRKNLTKIMKRADYEILIEDLTLKLKDYE